MKNIIICNYAVDLYKLNMFRSINCRIIFNYIVFVNIRKQFIFKLIYLLLWYQKLFRIINVVDMLTFIQLYIHLLYIYI